jgi:hypothetical protein
MKRTLTLLISAVFTAPLTFLLSAWLLITIVTKPVTDTTLGCTLVIVLAGIAATAIWIIF